VKDCKAIDILKNFVVHWIIERPKNALVAVEHRGKWFYIDDSDQVSKNTFSALYDLYNFVVGPAGGTSGPVLTLPVK